MGSMMMRRHTRLPLRRNTGHKLEAVEMGLRPYLLEELMVVAVGYTRGLLKNLLKLQQLKQQLILTIMTSWTQTMQRRKQKRAMPPWTMKTKLVMEEEATKAMTA
jgi:hypothetical protein